MTEDEMVGWHHQANGHEFEQAPGDGEGQRRLECCSPRGHKESDTSEGPNNKVGSPCCVGFRCTADQPVIHIHISTLFRLAPLFPLQNIEQSSLCCTVGSC